MAKRRKTKKSKMSGVRRRRSRVSGIGAIDFMNIIAVAGGAVAGGLVNKFVPATINPKIVSGGKIALGIALPMFVLGFDDGQKGWKIQTRKISAT